MMNYVWAFLMLISIICAMFTGKIAEVSDSVLKGAEDAVGLVISILGIMAFWTGLMKIAEKSGAMNFLAKIFSPIIRFLFPEIPQKSDAEKSICMNITANILGLGNAATPFGIAAMKEMQKLNHEKDTATNSMVMFVVLNTASLQLIPTMLLALRQKHNATVPSDVFPCIWLASSLALIFGIICVKVFEKRRVKKHFVYKFSSQKNNLVA